MKEGVVLAEEPSIRRLLASSVRAGRWTVLAALVLVSGLLVLGQSVAAASLAGIFLMLFLFQRGERPGPAEAAARTELAEEPVPADIADVMPAPPLASPVLEALDMPVLLIGPSEMVLHQNASALRLFGPIPAGSYLGAYVRSPGILDMVRDTFSSGRVTQLEHSERLPSEAVYLVRAALAASQPAGQQGQGAGAGDAGMSGRLLVLSFTDISQTRRIDRMRSDFVANASHELRTPLASLTGFIETLQGPARNDTKAQERFLAIMYEQATRMSRLVDDLLSLSRLELKSHLPPQEEVELGPLIGHVHDSLQPLAVELGVTIALSLPEQPVRVRGDRDELIEVVENLIENACKYGQEGKKVEVTLAVGANGPELSVRDYGPGIPPEHVPRITERFYRVNVETSRTKKGTGLGLAIVKHILTRHRARLVVESEVGRGTVFTVRF
ncbi:two-component system, OmpR family, phosphate regulon sensor histidine kinase PhoR [Rhizobium sp. RU20A]|uniref:ATP-binding protein n=1 Tax=Rhizobium sp. RU20A TaxID=1907412 RepID=UPI000957294E|nr:ATP-binding protein [Rhizobium sp. RU20A]SIQ62185.1 two-component system, OmpR family, phosphate regulon sensor histidine kinase PhoR [Rhizobium sp. RU20A]